MRAIECVYLLLAFGASAACSEGDSKPKAAAGAGGTSGSAGASSGGAAGVGEAVTSYTPEGCGHTVTLPGGIQGGTLDGSLIGADPTPSHVHVTWAGPSSS